MTDCITARARVLATKAHGRIDVALAAGEACPGCRCGRLAIAPGARTAELTLDGSAPVRVGDEILLTLPGEAVLRAALWLHGLPLAGLLAGAVLGTVGGLGDLGCLAGAVAGLTCALVLLRCMRRRWRSHGAAGLEIAPTA